MDKKIPLRMCLGCREMKPKNELIRIVNNGGEIFIDATGKANGRGAYICRNVDCYKKAVKGKALNKQFKCEISNDFLQKLLEETTK